MSTNKNPKGNIHKIREFELEKIRLADEFDILQIVGEGWFGKILLVEHRATGTEMVLKALPKPYVSLRDFYREFHYGLHLGIHKNIVTTYDVAFETAGFYVFTQEYALLGDLTSNMSDTGIGELHSKRVAKQIASALDYMHSKGIVHRDIKLDNVLIYKSDFSRVKLCDFGESFENGTVVERRNEWLPYSPPEVLQVEPEGTYKADSSHDVWQFGIVIFVCLTGCLPWQKAAADDPRYMRYLAWQATNMVLPLRRTPKLFKLLSSKGSRMFRKFLEPKQDRRPRNLLDLSKFMDDRWLAKGAEKDMAETEQDVLCPSMYSFHSSPEEKNKLLSTLAEHGIETTVDRVSKKNRIKDWIESSVIVEDDEEEESESVSQVPREPVAGHISSVRADEARQREIKTTIKDASNKHFDPRTGNIQHGPSEMGTVFRNKSLGDLTNGKSGSLYTGSIVTLASRNDLILSEGQSFHSELNLYMIGDSTPEPMVNARLNVPVNNSNANGNSNSTLYNQSVDLKFANRNANNSQQRKSEQLAPRHYSSSALNVVNNYDSNLNLNNKAREALATTFQSLATISVPEVKPQGTPIKDSGYGSIEKIKTTDINQQMVPVNLPNRLNKNLSSSSSLTNSQSSIAKDNSNVKQLSSRQAEVLKPMKDTAYDRITVRKRK